MTKFVCNLLSLKTTNNNSNWQHLRLLLLEKEFGLGWGNAAGYKQCMKYLVQDVEIIIVEIYSIIF